ncbi:MAG: chloride channel protein, partial [Deltaproteobacteria bacterium]
PLAGFAIGWIYQSLGRDIQRGNNLIFEEIHEPKQILPARMAPLILLGTVVTHLFGGSAGREGTAVQMGAALSDQLNQFFKIDPKERKILLIAGVGASFGAAIGTPWAGIVFGMEVLYVGRLKIFAALECLIASFCAYATTLLLKAPHTVYPRPHLGLFSLTTLAWVSVAGILFGLVAVGFCRLTHLIEKLETRWISYAPLRPFVGGLVLIALYFSEGSFRYAGLGISTIQNSFLQVSSFKDPFFKCVATAITIASGFKGGEFIPLVFMGSTLGSALTHFLPVSTDLLAAVGFAAVFGAASNTPLACTLMAIELFGVGIAPYALVGCLMAYLFSSHRGIYSSQLIRNPKPLAKIFGK